MELAITKNEVYAWSVGAIFGLLSISIAVFAPDPFVTLAGYIYFLMFPIQGIVLKRGNGAGAFYLD
ncbi:MAG: hypothetical protein AAF197_00835 [Pseudomonadota bacterium]